MHALRTETDYRSFALLALAVLLAYANALTGSFQFDDYNVIVDFPPVHDWQAWYAHLNSGIRPLLKLSYTLNWTLSPLPFGFHALNLLIHLTNAWLVYRLAHCFIQHQTFPAQLRHAPLLAALLFALHPIHTEAVSYISGRSSSLMTLFYLAALLAYVSGRMQRNAWRLYLWTPVFFLCALATKETAITLPAALLAWEYCCGGTWHTRIRAQWPVWLLAGITILFFLSSAHYFHEMQRSAAHDSLQNNLATRLYALSYLLRQWALPLWLNIDPALPSHPLLGDLLWPLLLFAILSGVILACRTTRPWLSFAGIWLLLHLLPLYILLPRLDIANEREMYLAGWPLFLVLAIEISLWFEHRARLVFATALLVLLGGLTLSRNFTYQDEISLWQDTVRQSPNKARVHNNLGMAYLAAQRYADARQEFSFALKIDPDFYRARYNLYRVDDEATLH